MNTILHERIKSLLEETNAAFESAGRMNSDYAGFASMALSDFKEAMKSPSLTAQDLRRIIRKAHVNHKHMDPEGSWSAYIATYIAQTCNDPAQISFEKNCEEKP